MRKLTALIAAVMAVLAAALLPASASAQYLINQSYVRPVHLPKITVNWVTDIAAGNGATFTGKAVYSDGNVTRYEGTLTYPNGDKIYSGQFLPNFTYYEGSYDLYVPASQDKAYQRVARNGQMQVTNTYDIRGRAFMVSGSSLQYIDNGASSTYSSGSSSYSSGSSTGSSSNYNRHEAQCRGCNGSGLCQRCNGSGWNYNRTHKCSLCHGTGRCQSCAGVGKIYGNF